MRGWSQIREGAADHIPRVGGSSPSSGTSNGPLRRALLVHEDDTFALLAAAVAVIGEESARLRDNTEAPIAAGI